MISKLKKNNFKSEVEPKVKVPTDLKKALGAKPLVEAVWDSLTPLARWDFIIWINQTREPLTRKRRIQKTVSLLTAGKRRPCCFTIMPADFYKALWKNPKAKNKWQELGPVARRNLVTWIDSAKQGELTKERANQACELLVSGKSNI